MCIMKKPFSAQLLLRLILWSVGAFWLAKPGFAATITVINLNDSGAGSLRQAIADAVPGDMINFTVTGTINLTNGELLVTNDLAIIGPGATNLSIVRSPSAGYFRLLEVASGTVGISGQCRSEEHTYEPQSRFGI